MSSIIRTQTFLRYARIHLQEAETALQQERSARVLRLCSDAAAAITKALAAGLPGVETGLIETDAKALVRALSYLTEAKEDATAIGCSLVELRQELRQLDHPPSKAEAEAAFRKAGEASRAVHDLFAL
jgi:hypothetical protein